MQFFQMYERAKIQYKFKIFDKWKRKISQKSLRKQNIKIGMSRSSNLTELELKRE